jgi:hypothetical protein
MSKETTSDLARGDLPITTDDSLRDEPRERMDVVVTS